VLTVLSMMKGCDETASDPLASFVCHAVFAQTSARPKRRIAPVANGMSKAIVGATPSTQICREFFRSEIRAALQRT
jgi:hypothetical protein